MTDPRTGDPIEILIVDAQTNPEPTRVVIIGGHPRAAMAALRDAGIGLVIPVAKELAPRIDPALLIAMLEPMDLQPKHKPTRAEWRRAMKGGRS